MKTLCGAAFLVMLFSCESKSSSVNTSNVDTSVVERSKSDISGSAEYQAGLELAAKSDCFSCHAVDEKKVGPSYQSIAIRYSQAEVRTIETLTSHILKGGAGVWGTVPMPPHPTLTPDEAKAIVKYILLLRNK
jgi:cytochrome c